MKKTIKLLAIAFVAMSMAMVSCTKEEGKEGSETVVYTDLESNPMVIGGYNETPISFGGQEFQIQNEGEMAFFAIFKAGAGVVSTTGQYYDNVAVLQENTEIGANSRFTMYKSEEGYANADLYSYEYTAWAGQTAYIGVCFTKDGELHYGWIKMKAAVSGETVTFTVYGYAYESVAGKSIKAGQK